MAKPRPKVTIDTERGTLVVELFSDKTPKTVANFVKLAREGFYNGIKFHRVIPDFVIQGGCPKGTGTGGPGYTIDCEIVAGLKHVRGALSMAHAGTCRHEPSTGTKLSGECSNGSQFFIVRKPQPHLDGVHTVFGQVIEGIDIIDSIRQNDTMRNVTVEDGE